MPTTLEAAASPNTAATLRGALRDDPIWTAEQMGYKDARFTFRVYQKAAKRREKLSGQYLEACDAVLDWAQMGTNGDLGTHLFAPSDSVQVEETASESQK